MNPKSKINDTLLLFIWVVFFTRFVFPNVKYIFFPLLFIISGIILISNFKIIKKKLILFIQNNILVIINLLIFVFALSFSTLDTVIIKELFQIFTLITLFIITYIVINYENLFIFIKKLSISIIVLSFIISIIGLLKLFYGIKGIDFHHYYKGIFTNSTSLIEDYNFFSLFILISIILALYKLFNLYTIRKKILINIFLYISSINIILSVSRRAFIVLLIVLTTIVIINIISLVQTNSKLSNFRNNTKYFILSILLSFFCIWSIFKLANTNDLIGFTVKNGFNEIRFKTYTANLVFKYKSIIIKNINYDETYRKLWPKLFDPKYPFSGWGTRIYEPVIKLEGKGFEVIPNGAIGYKIDSSSNAHTWDNNAYSYTLISDSIVNPKDELISTVFCFVSQEFDGEWVVLRSEGSGIGTQESSYDLSRKGEWQLLQLNANCSNGNANVYMYFAKYNVLNFKSLKGYVIFAYPTYRINRYIKDTTKNDLSTIMNISKKQIVTAELLNLDKLFNNVKTNCFFKDKIDTTESYLKYNKEIFIGPRLDRWRYGLVIYNKSYNIRQKIFGGGFDYMSKFGEEFNGNPKELDWPHNPILSILLYGGIVGLFLYFVLIYKVCSLYWKYKKECWHYAFCFIIAFIFSLFSANNPFDHPITGFFILLPFFINSMHKRQVKSTKIV